MSNLPEERGGKNHPEAGKQLQIVVGTSGAVAASVVLLTEPEGIQRVGRWQEREQDHDLLELKACKPSSLLPENATRGS